MNNMMKRLEKGERLLGISLGGSDFADIPIILKRGGLDYFLIDTEHGDIDFSRAAAIITIARAHGIDPVVRVPGLERGPILRFAEMGAVGIKLPNMETAKQAEKFVEYSKYAPLGDRGVSLMKANANYDTSINPLEYMREANENLTLIALIESQEGINNIDEIMAVEGIDIAFVGPNDLSQSLGIMGQYTHPDFIAAVDKVVAACKKYNKYCGINSGSIEQLLWWSERGMTYNYWGSDLSILINSIKLAVKEYKS